MKNRFSNVFFVVPRHLKKNNFVSKFWSQHRGAELGCQQTFSGNYDIVYDEGSEYTKSKIPLGLKYGVLFCHRLQK